MCVLQEMKSTIDGDALMVNRLMCAGTEIQVRFDLVVMSHTGRPSRQIVD